MNGEYQLPVSRETVWAKLNDTETLKACIPGCESIKIAHNTRQSRAKSVRAYFSVTF
jgi:carbon monoxide dehydrogenase subunit G